MDSRKQTCLLHTIFVLLVFGASSAAPPSEEDVSRTEPALLIVSYDAFRPDYFKRGVTPFMNEIRKKGTWADFVYNVFPTKTFPNHHTIATGHYPKSHGVLANSLHDAKLGAIGYGYELFHYNESIWPIWTANEKAGKHSGCMMWPGSGFAYENTSCTFTHAFDMNVTMTERVDIAIDWFKHEQTPANLVMLYIEQPDYLGHVYSPDSTQVTKIVSQLDQLTRYIHQKLSDEHLTQRVNVIHLSDHGMSSVSSPNFINLTDFIQNDSVDFYGTSPVLQIVPKDNNLLDEIHRNLTEASLQNGHFKVYTPDDLPGRLNASNAQRMGPLMVVADMDYAFQDMWVSAKYFENIYKVPITPETKYGVHGYDNAEKLMHAIFFARGPHFASNQQLEPFNTVDLYNLFCRILRIECKPNEGTDRTTTWDALLRTTATPTKPVRPHLSGKIQQFVASLYDRIRSYATSTSTPTIRYISFGGTFIISLIIIAIIHMKRKRDKMTKEASRLNVSDTAEAEKLLQTNGEATI